MSNPTNTSKNKVKFGLSNVHIFPIKNETSTATTYGEVIKIPGAVNLTLSASGDDNTFYADDIAYFKMWANNGYEGDLEMAILPEEFLITILGQRKDSSGAVVESANDISKDFAMAFEFQGDVKRTRNILYKVTASRPDDEHATVTETKEPQTDSISIAALPRMNDQLIKARIEEGKTGYSTFYDKVYEPKFS